MHVSEGEKMIYVISDIHGCYEEYLALLEKINFNEADRLYVLGDVVDRGPEPVKVLFDMMERSNVYPIVGNHEYMALKVLNKFQVNITEETIENTITKKDMMNYMEWVRNGGDTTIEEFRQLTDYEQEDLLDYLENFSLYEEVMVNGRKYVLVHADIHGFDETKKLEDYDFSDFIFYRANYDKRYYSDENTYLVTGHTPVMLIRKDKYPLVYEEHGHIAIDCGCVFGQRLAAYCLDTGKTFYVEKNK